MVPKLLLLPAGAARTGIDRDALARQLGAIGLIGKTMPCNGESIHCAGDRFLQLITFLGCAPAVELEPPANELELEQACEQGRFCHVLLAADNGELRYRGDHKAPCPRCPQCRKPEHRWSELLARWQSSPGQASWQCQACGHRGRLFDLNFRRAAGFGSCFVEIRGIHPDEAVPGEKLLAALRDLTRCDWEYIYIRD